MGDLAIAGGWRYTLGIFAQKTGKIYPLPATPSPLLKVFPHFRRHHFKIPRQFNPTTRAHSCVYYAK